MLSPTRGGGEEGSLWPCAASRRPRGSSVRGLEAVGGAAGCSHTPPARCGWGWARGALRGLAAASAPRPGRRAAPGKLLVGARTAGPRLPDPQRVLRGCHSPALSSRGALPCPHLGSCGLLLPTTCFPGSPASTLSSATSTPESGRPSRHPACRRPPSFVVR